MTITVILLRGINVGGHHKLPMQALRSLAQAQGARDVSTYIQSGNMVCRVAPSKRKSFDQKLSAAIDNDFGFKPDIMMFSHEAFRDVMLNMPFKIKVVDASKLHLVFLPKPADKGKVQEIEALLAKDEQIKAVGSAIFLNAPAGIGRSKAAEKLSRVFTGATMRNLRTCRKLDEMAAALA